ncbi:transmembrane protein 14C-like [Denticeps clupeoides]|uniref:Transmembrane protein 14C n=1 Tax=Denticeps clupeoides TaxID=299321 RepID=A0AAY4ET55_9TELE|nr:transmembrane protein 14C-like [Denticeps clupeoides]
MAADAVGYLYAALVLSGGAVGYVKAGSVTSLLAGLFFGVLAGLGTHRLSKGPGHFWLLLGTSGTLALVMGVRFFNSWNFMPAGLITGASLLVVMKICVQCFLQKSDKPRQT